MQRRQLLGAIAAGATAPIALKLTRLAAQPTSPPLSAYDSVAAPMLARMTLDEKLGQMTQAELGKLEHEGDMERWGWARS